MGKYIYALLCALIFFQSLAYGQEGERPKYQMPRSEVINIESKLLDRSYDLYIKLPPGYSAKPNKNRAYPVLYVNDSDYTFQTVAGVTHVPMIVGGYEHAIIVGLSFTIGEGVIESRSRDFTPFPLGPTAKYEHGGAHHYLRARLEIIIE